jgi:streptogramin lyase
MDDFLPELCAGEVLPAAVETCGDGIDNDCNGTGDEEVFGPCGDCDVTCRSDGPVVPVPSDPGASGLGTNPDGPGVVLGSEDVRAGYLWAANDPDGSVSKLDLATGAEVARYRVGMWGDGCDSPSRTAVDGLGNAYVAARAHVGCAGRNQGSVTKMAGDRRFCVDRNGNTVIDTSTGPAALALGADECVLWRVPLGGAGGIPRALAIDLGDEEHPEGHPWVGAYNEMRGYQLDPDDGAVLNTVDFNVNSYGFAIDSNGWIWISGRGPARHIQRFHTVTLAVEPAIPIGACGGLDPYGITVDVLNRVWVGIWLDGNCCAARYNPADGSWFGVNTRPGWGGVRGIAADADGTIWAAIHQNWGGGAIASFNGDDGSGLVVRDIAGVIPVGVGVDELGHVWTVNQATSNVTRLTKATGALEQFPVGPSPYTYSDFTGYQRRLMVPRGTWTRDYERCAVDSFDRWGTITWDADVPVGAELSITGASADTSAGLDAASSVSLAAVPSDVPPVDVEAAFAVAGVPLLRFLRVTVTLEASPDRESPVFRSLDVRWHCYRMP